MKHWVWLFLLLAGCDTVATMGKGCDKQDVKGTTCVVCGSGGSSVAVSCDWSEKR